MTSSAYRFETLNVTEPSEFVYHVEIKDVMQWTRHFGGINTTVTLVAVNFVFYIFG